MALSAVFELDRQNGPSLPDELLQRFLRINLESVLEENRANPNARIRPLTHTSVDLAYQAESVGKNSSFSILIDIR